MKNRQQTTGRAPFGATLMLACTLPLVGCTGGADSDLEPWRGTLAEGLAAMEDLAAEGQFDEALLVADRMDRAGALAALRARAAEITAGASEDLLAPLDRSLSGLGLPVLTSPERGEIQFARAVALLGSAAQSAGGTGATGPGSGGGPDGGPDGGPGGGPDGGPDDAAGRMDRAVAAFERARASGGGASLDAVYDLGTLDLLTAEAIRQTLPEISGGPPPPPASDKDAVGGKDDRDPLDLARAAYLASREGFVERLRMGAGEDARANAELVLRRLRELDEIERQREEQQEQQDPQDEGDPSEESQENENSEDQDSEDQEQDPSDSEDQEQQGDQESESEQPSEDQAEEDGQEPEDQPEDDSEEDSEEGSADESPDEEEDEGADPEGEPEEERLMTAEERSRILDRNRKYQENGEELRRILRLGRKVPARRDW